MPRVPADDRVDLAVLELPELLRDAPEEVGAGARHVVEALLQLVGPLHGLLVVCHDGDGPGGHGERHEDPEELCPHHRLGPAWEMASRGSAELWRHKAPRSDARPAACRPRRCP
eukprot:14163698-Alexandrium_andersonii.AAC.1